jgi:branched-chain amino acid transport system substrate-binding protein
MKLRITFAAVAALALVVVAAAFAGSDGKAAKAARGSAAIACGTTRTIGVAAPLTGPAASIGTQQLRWAQYYVKRWNAVKANAKQKIAIVQGDTQLGVDTAFAVKVAQSFASNPKVLGVVGPAGSQEVVASTSALKGAGLGFVSGSASRVSLTDGHTDGVNRQGYFFRTVPNDNVQGPTVAN